MRNAAKTAKAFRFCTRSLVNMLLSSSLPEPGVEGASEISETTYLGSGTIILQSSLEVLGLDLNRSESG